MPLLESCSGISKAFASRTLFENISLGISEGERLGLIGRNGSGKSTLLRMLAGAEKFDGELEDGYQVVKSYFAQHQIESLNLENDLLTELQEYAPDVSDGTLRGLLGAFLFAGDDVFKKIKVLSGGEKSRVALAKTILSKANFLILDEPTNHLDIQSVKILTEVLQDYEGTYVVVSHDRYFLSQIANKIWWIEDHQLREYPGNYEEYEYSKKEKPEEKKAPAPKTKKEEKPKQADDAEAKKQQKKLQGRFAKLEEQIASLKEQRAQLESELALPEVYQSPDRFQTILEKFNAAGTKLDQLNSEWEEVFELLNP